MTAILQTMRSGTGTQHPQEIVNFFGSFLMAVGGVKDVTDNDFLVEQNGTPDMSVNVNMGRAMVPTSDLKMAYPVELSSSVYNQAISSNGSGNGRKDAIVLYIDTAATPNTAVTNVAKIAVVEGTPAPSPAAPSDSDISTAVGASNPFIRLANVTVDSGAVSIANAKIEDTRDDAEIVLGQPRIRGSKQEYVTLTDGPTVEIDLKKGSKFQLTLGGNRTITLKAPPSGKDWAGRTFVLRVTQDGTGNRLISSLFGSYTVKYPDGAAFTLTTTAGKTDKIGFEVMNDGATIEATMIAQNI